MDLSLINYPDMGNNDNNKSNNYHPRHPDIENNNIRRIDDRDYCTLLGLIKGDKSLRVFLIVLGYYIRSDKDTLIVMILARLWQFCLLLFGGIGFIWQSFVVGVHYIKILHHSLSLPQQNSLDLFLLCGRVLITFVVPILQVISLTYGVYSIYNYKQMHQAVKIETISPLLASCKRNASIFFICMAILVMSIDPYAMTRKFYANVVLTRFDDEFLHQVGVSKYSTYAFGIFTSGIFFNLTLACYLSVMLFFISLTLKQINALQEDIIKMIDDNTLNLTIYCEQRCNIISYRDGTYFSTECLTITAGINVIAVMFQLWGNHHFYIIGSITYEDMIFFNFTLFPFLFKGDYIIITIMIVIIILSLFDLEIVFFFYILYLALAINTMHDKVVDCANQNFWEIRKRYNVSKNSSDLELLLDYSVIQKETYSVFKLASIDIRRGRVLITLGSFLLFSFYLLLKISQTI